MTEISISQLAHVTGGAGFDWQGLLGSVIQGAGQGMQGGGGLKGAGMGALQGLMGQIQPMLQGLMGGGGAAGGAQAAG